MGVRRHQYGKEMDKPGKSLQEQHKRAAKRSSVKPEIKTRTGKKVPSKKKLLAKTKRRLYELWHGEKAYLKKRKKKK